jgi:hypothetical protein
LLNFDLVVTNSGSHGLRLAEIECSVFDSAGKLVMRKALNSNGLAPGIEAVANQQLNPGETAGIFNPFYSLAEEVPVGRMEYALPGSGVVKAGDLVYQGGSIGRVGFSGDALGRRQDQHRCRGFAVLQPSHRDNGYADRCRTTDSRTAPRNSFSALGSNCSSVPCYRLLAACTGNLAARAVFFHNGQFLKLQDALRFCVRRDSDPRLRR